MRTREYKVSKTKWIIIAILISFCLIFVVLTLYKKFSIFSEYNNIADQWNRELLNLKITPTPENVFTVHGERNWIVDKEKELKLVLSNKQIKGPSQTPLQFKEELLNTQIKLKQLSDIQGCKLQEDLGFLEYTAGEIPGAGEVAKLKKQLTITNELINIFLRHKVSEICSLQRMPDIYEGEDNLYSELVFKLQIKCTLEDLLGVLADIINSPYILVVRNIKIDKLDEARIDVVLILGAVEAL